MADYMTQRAIFQKPRTKSIGWSVMLADMSLLLMAFFALMVAQSGEQSTAQRNGLAEKIATLEIPKDATSLMTSLRDQHTVLQPLDFDIQKEPLTPHITLTKLDPVEELFKSVSDDMSTRSFTVARSGDEIILSLGSVAGFSTGSADLDASAIRGIETLGQLLAGVSSDISVEGHADAGLLISGRFKDNWELAGARAAAVLRELSRAPGIAASSLRAVSYGEHRPVMAGAATASDSNRRVEIRIRPN